MTYHSTHSATKFLNTVLLSSVTLVFPIFPVILAPPIQPIRLKSWCSSVLSQGSYSDSVYILFHNFIALNAIYMPRTQIPKYSPNKIFLFWDTDHISKDTDHVLWGISILIHRKTDFLICFPLPLPTPNPVILSYQATALAESSLQPLSTSNP